MPGGALPRPQGAAIRCDRCVRYGLLRRSSSPPGLGRGARGPLYPNLAGGKALNQAVALARLGAHVFAIGAVGDDGLGRDIMSALTREGIDTDFFVTCEKAATSICICFVGDDGQTSFVWHIDDNVAVTPEIVRAAEPALRRADAVLVTFEAPVPTIREAIKIAHRCDAQVYLQPAPYLAGVQRRFGDRRGTTAQRPRESGHLL